MQKTPSRADAQANRASLSRLLARQAPAALPASPVRTHFDQIQQLMAGEDLLDIDTRLRSLQTDDPWLAGAAAAYARGCPTSAALAFALLISARRRLGFSIEGVSL